MTGAIGARCPGTFCWVAVCSTAFPPPAGAVSRAAGTEYSNRISTSATMATARLRLRSDAGRLACSRRRRLSARGHRRQSDAGSSPVPAAGVSGARSPAAGDVPPWPPTACLRRCRLALSASARRLAFNSLSDVGVDGCISADDPSLVGGLMAGTLDQFGCGRNCASPGCGFPLAFGLFRPGSWSRSAVADG